LVVTTISLKVPGSLLELIEQEARIQHTTKSSVIRECLEKALGTRLADARGSCYDRARDLAGSVKGLPRDLATNPKYPNGFGR
jgi:hypothetical protein